MLSLENFTVTSIEKIGSGDRVCVDTCSLLNSGEGLLVGSTSKVFLLVEAEVNESGFVNSRPFRINAGVVASYVLNGQKTAYLSELEAGSKVMVVNKNGETKFENVARVKIERRPLILLKVEYQGKHFPIILQDAETVRLVNPSGSIPVNELKIGDTLMGSISISGRHFGMEVEEFVEEK